MTSTAFAVAPAPAPIAMLPLKVALPPGSESLLRPELRATLAEARLAPVTTVVAPAGYGKTTLLAAWGHELARTGADVCWLTLDANDREPAALLSYLIYALQRPAALSMIGERAWRILHSAADLRQDWPLVTGALCSDLQASLSSPTFLLLDDLHALADSPLATEILSFVLRAAPPALHVVIASRRAPVLAPLPRLRAQGLLAEIGQADLRLSLAQTEALLARQGVELAASDLALLAECTEGWALSVGLAARVLGRQPAAQRPAQVRTLVENQPDLFAYLASDVLADLPPRLVEFLQIASLPQHFDAALLSQATKLRDAPALLDAAGELGVALLPLDNEGSAQRLHPLWRALLLRQARERLDDARWLTYQVEFGRAFERRGSLELALAHYVDAGATDELARALREHAWPLLNSPRRASIRQWIERLPVEVRNADPELRHMWAWSQTGVAPAEAAEALSAAADGYRARGMHDRELRALSDLAALLFWQDRAIEFDLVCVRAIRAANRVRDDWARGAALVAVVALLYSRGRPQAALRVARHADAYPRNLIWQWMLAMILGSIYTQLGRPAQALTAIDVALGQPQIDGDDRLRQNLRRLRALALYQQGNSSEALALALEAHTHLSDYYQDGSSGSSALMLALLLGEQGRHDEALTYVGQARAVADGVASLVLLGRVRAVEAHLERLRGDVDAAGRAAADAIRQLEATEGPASDLWLRLLLAVALGEGGHADAARAALNRLIPAMSGRGYGLFLAAALLYRAADERGGNDVARDADLREGWALLEATGGSFVPALPAAALRQAVVGALRLGLATQAMAALLRRQLPEQATALLIELLSDNAPEVRARAARLLGDLGASAAYPALRALLKDRQPDVRQAAESALGRLMYVPPYQLRVRTLGTFGVWRGDSEVRDRDWRSVKARHLLQLLLIERGRLIPRERVLDALWPELESEAAANNLRVTLSRLYKALEPERPDGAPSHYIQQHGETYGFNMASDFALDAAQFSDAVAAGQRAERLERHDEAVAAYRKAIALYNGTFLPDSLYEDWSVIERERLGLLFNLAALRLGELLLEEGLVHEAMGLAWRVLEHDGAQEEAYQLLMRAYGDLGERSTALRIYQRCVKTLREELGVEPLPETTALFEVLRRS
jgi:ATP/maltotriose-dependent transcriptional regulator MalT/DNA-binding SARP family transcriptional activator